MKGCFIIIALVVTCVIGLVFWRHHERTEALNPVRAQALEQAEKDGRAAIARRAKELEEWYLLQKANSAAAAEDLCGWTSKYKVVEAKAKGDDTELKKHFDKTLQEHFCSAQDCQKETAHVIAELLRDWEEIEDTLARQSECPTLSHGRKEEAVSGKSVKTGNYKSELEKQIAGEIASMVGGEVAGAVITRLAVSAGILGAGAVGSLESAGISLVAGIVVDAAVSWYTDTEGKIKTSLDAEIEKSAKEQRKNFEAAMNKAFDNLLNEWKEQL